MAQALDGVAAQGRVGGNDAIHRVALEGGGNHINLCVVQVGGNLDKNRHPLAVLRGQGFAAFGNAAQQRVERFVALQRAQVFGVGAGNVDGDVVGMRIHAIKADQVVVHCVFNRRGGIFTNVQAQQQCVFCALLAQPGLLHVGQKSVQPVIVEAQPVDQRIGFGQAKHARFGVAGLAFGCHGADFDKAESHRRQAIDAAGVLVESGRQAHAVGKLQPGQLDRVADLAAAVCRRQRRALGARQRSHGQLVGGFGVEPE